MVADGGVEGLPTKGSTVWVPIIVIRVRRRNGTHGANRVPSVEYPFWLLNTFQKQPNLIVVVQLCV